MQRVKDLTQEMCRVARRISMRGVAGAAPVIAAICLASPAALAQPTVCDEYDIEHDFEWTVNHGGNRVLELTAKQFCHAWVIDKPISGADCTDYEVVPGRANQPDDWNEFGRDHVRANATVRTDRTSSGSIEATVMENVYQIDAGMPALAAVALTELAEADCNSNSEANSSVEIDAHDTDDQTVTGTIRSWGEACAVLPEGWRSAEAYAFSMSAVEARGGKENGRGRIRWGPKMRAIVADSATARARRQVDPIEFRATNLVTGDVIEGKLLSIDFAMEADQPVGGGFIWDNGLLICDVQNSEFSLDLTSPYITAGGGTLNIEIRNGVVTAASDSGDYAGLAPAVGTFVPLVIPLVNDFDIEYELPIYNTGDDYEVELTFGGGGVAEDALGAGGCPADLDGDGVVGSPDLAIVLGTWGAPCADDPTQCDADLNGDMEINSGDLAEMLGMWGPCPDGGGGGVD